MRLDIGSVSGMMAAVGIAAALGVADEALARPDPTPFWQVEGVAAAVRPESPFLSPNLTAFPAWEAELSIVDSGPNHARILYRVTVDRPPSGPASSGAALPHTASQNVQDQTFLRRPDLNLWLRAGMSASGEVADGLAGAARPSCAACSRLVPSGFR